MLQRRLTISQKLHDTLVSLISASTPGDRLPSEPKLSAQLGVSRATLREAMRSFETQGILRRRQGSGTYVMQPPAIIESGMELLESIETLAKRIGLDVSMGALNIEKRTPSFEECEALDIKNTSEVLSISRVILAQNKPVAYLIDIVPSDVLSQDDLRSFRGSVLDLFLLRGDPVLQSSRCEINAQTANPDIARAFGIQRGDVLIFFKSWLFTNAGKVIDYSFSYFLPGYFRFHVIRRVGE